MAELDRELARFGGLRPLMKLFFERYKHRVVTSEEFNGFLNSVTLMDLDPFFKRYALGQAQD